MTAIEKYALTECEAVIERGLSSFIEVGNALVKIRDGRLYRADFKTFEGYCSQRWNLKRQRAYELMGAASVAGCVSEISDKSQIRESHLAPLKSLPPETQRQVWKAAVETAGGKVTAAHVVRVKERFAPLAEEARSKAEEDSEKLWALKTAWNRASKKDKALFIEWIKE